MSFKAKHFLQFMNSCDEILNKAFILTNVGIFEKYITSIVQCLSSLNISNAAIAIFYKLLKLSNLSYSLNFCLDSCLFIAQKIANKCFAHHPFYFVSSQICHGNEIKRLHWQKI